MPGLDPAVPPGPRRLGPPAASLPACLHTSSRKETHFFADTLKGSGSSIQVLPLQSSGHLDTDARRAFRDDREAEAGDEHASLQEPLADPDGECGIADDN